MAGPDEEDDDDVVVGMAVSPPLQQRDSQPHLARALYKRRAGEPPARCDAPNNSA
jgi:hypothetical protein